MVKAVAKKCAHRGGYDYCSRLCKPFITSAGAHAFGQSIFTHFLFLNHFVEVRLTCKELHLLKDEFGDKYTLTKPSPPSRPRYTHYVPKFPFILFIVIIIIN